MRIKALIEEDFVQYSKPVMFIGTCFCNWKCCIEQNLDKSICQNSALAKSPFLQVDDETLIERYLANPITQGIVFGGLEPFEQFEELKNFIASFRNVSNDEIVIYTGFYPKEISKEIVELQKFPNIIVKFGRFIPNDVKHYDEVLGVELASSNQFAVRLDDYAYESSSK